MNKKKIGIVCVVAAAAAAAIICLKTFAQPSADSESGVVYVNTVANLTGLGSGNGMINRFGGVVESQETWSVQQNPEKTVKETLVAVGDEVKAGDALFTYDTEQFKSELAQAQIDLERIQNEIVNMNAAIAELEKEKKSAPSSSQAAYTMQIQEQQLQVKQREFDAQSKQLEINKLNENINNATVFSEIDGVIKSINTGNNSSYGSNDDSFITVMRTGDFRIKGSINEQNTGSISQGSPVVVHSRIDEAQTWKGTVTKIDYDNPQSEQNYYSSDSSASSSKYPFYVELENSEGLMMGQHVYIEMDYGQTQEKEGLWIDSYMIDLSDESAPFVWADNGSGRLEKRAVTLGEYDDDLMEYQILDGLTEEDAITFPEEGLEEGMATAVSNDGMMGQSMPMEEDGVDADMEEDSVDIGSQTVNGMMGSGASVVVDEAAAY